MSDGEKVVYCQVDAHLDSNPKIRRGGRDARDVFEFLLRRVAIGRTQGTVPLKYIEPWYLADQLMMSEDDARHGTSQAVTVRLIELDHAAGVVRIVGWAPEWGRRPKEGSERTREWRDRKANQAKPDERVTDCDDARRSVTTRDGCDVGDVGEERRGEEKEKASAPPPAGGMAELRTKVDRATGEIGARRAKKADTTPDEQAAAERVLSKLSERNGVRYSASKEHVRLIAAQLRSGVSESDLARVVSYCAVKLEWATKPEMAPYLRPETLFGPKTIARYLDPARTWSPAPRLRVATPEDDAPQLDHLLRLPLAEAT